MRLQEVHPSLVHFPIALLPASLLADALGRLTGSRGLMEVGRLSMPLAAASAAVAGVFGLIAQEAVNAEGEAHDHLVTHRNLNLGLIGLTAAMAARRIRRRRPGAGYLLAGAAGLAAMSYSAYLGGHMVYELGVGVSAAGGVREGNAPELRPDNVEEVRRIAGENLAAGARHALEHLERGEVAPVLTRASHPGVPRG